MRTRLNERGFVLIWATLMLTVLMGMAGFAVDIGNWYLKVQRAQRSADAAALNGAPYLPADPVAAVDAARETLRSNGVPDQFVNTAVVRPVNGKPAQMYVRVDTTAENTFLRLFGIAKSSSFSRAAVATWSPPLKMGNFSNVLGQEPPDASKPHNDQWQIAPSRAQQREYWLSIAGPRTFQGRGDEYTGQKCRVRNTSPAMSDGCTNVGYNGNSQSFISPPSGGAWAEAQYTFTVTVKEGAPGTRTKIEIYDPEFALTGPYCKPPYWGGGKQAQLFALTNNQRHNPNNTAYCAGDHQYVDNNLDQSVPFAMPTTSFRVYDEDKNPVCPTRTFRPFGPPVGSAYQTNPGLDAYAGDSDFNKWFHNWVEICEVSHNSSKDHTYRIQVWTDDNTEGINHFAIRAGIVNGGGINQGASNQFVRVSADEHLPLYSNKESADMRFAIAEVPMSMAGSEVRFWMFDIGDCNHPSDPTQACPLSHHATFKLQSDSTSASSPGGSSTASCTYTPVNNPTNFVNMPGCQLTNVHANNGYNGKKLAVVWTIPDDYTCGATVNGKSCFLFMNVDFPVGITKVDDISTWSIDGEGSPVHLIKIPPNP